MLENYLRSHALAAVDFVRFGAKISCSAARDLVANKVSERTPEPTLFEK